MDSMFFNKIAGAVLLTILIGFVITELSHILVHPTNPDTVAYPVPEMAVAAAAGSDAMAAEEKGIDVAALLGGADPVAAMAAGAKAFKKCAACHTIDDGGKAKIGPNLFGILDRDIASVDGFKYSSAMSSFEGNWTYENLANFLRKPKDFVPKTAMAFAGVKKDSELAGLILFLRASGDADSPLPAGN
jgi:cytochrome c